MTVAIDVSRVSKRFSLDAERVSSLKERVVRRRRRAPAVPFMALDDISLQVTEGETVGLLGHNGSGKSTLLKMIGGIMKPTSGTVRTRGRVASLLELGAGFHPELTGRENVFINGALLGLSKADLRARFDDIVEFAELERFIDTQVRNYSSGMYVRLGFAVAVNVDPDILLVDEVLAVGDEVFQRKCLDRMHRFQREGRTIVVVSHSVDQLRTICDRVAVLDHGHLVAYGAPGQAIGAFRAHLLADQRERQADLQARHAAELAAAPEEATAEAEPEPAADRAVPAPEDGAQPAPAAPTAPTVQQGAPGSPLRITGVEVEYPDSEDDWLRPGDPVVIRVRYHAERPLDDVNVGFALYDSSDGRHLFGVNSKLLGIDLPVLSGDGEVMFQVEAVHLLDGVYPLSTQFCTLDYGYIYDHVEEAGQIQVVNDDRRVGTIALDVELKATSEG